VFGVGRSGLRGWRMTSSSWLRIVGLRFEGGGLGIRG